MNFLLLAAATPEAHAATGGPENLLQQFGIESTFLIMQLISFGILAFVLYRFMIKPVLGTVDERRTKIEAGLKYAEEMQAKLTAAQQATDTQLREAQQKAQQIIAEAQKAAKEFGDKQQKDAIEKANGLLAKAQQAIELEHKKMLADARQEIARLVVTTTERVLAKKLSETDRASYNDAAAKELANV